MVLPLINIADIALVLLLLHKSLILNWRNWSHRSEILCNHLLLFLDSFVWLIDVDFSPFGILSIGTNNLLSILDSIQSSIWNLEFERVSLRYHTNSTNHNVGHSVPVKHLLLPLGLPGLPIFNLKPSITDWLTNWHLRTMFHWFTRFSRITRFTRFTKMKKP